MEFNNIQLPGFVIASLYKHTLVVINEELKESGLQLAEGRQQHSDIEAVTIVEKKLTIENPDKIVKKPEHLTTITQALNEKYSGTIDFQPVEKEIPNVEVKKPAPIAPALNFKYLGGFGKKISIVLEDHFHPHINDDDLAFLTKLLQACQLSLNDVAIINVVSNQTYSNQLWQLMPAEKMIIFDIDPGTLGLPFRLSHFKLQPWSDCVFLASPSLQALQEGAADKVVQLKRSLWESLKKMFLA